MKRIFPNKNQKKSNSYFEEYIEYLKTQPFILPKNVEYYVNKYSFFKDLMHFVPCTLYLLDYQTQKYLYVSKECKSILGYTAESIIEKGHPWFLSKLHKDDLLAFTKPVFESFVNYTRSLPLSEIKNSRFSINYRICRNDGSYIQLFDQHIILEADNSGNPLLVFGVCTDITAHKSDTKVVFSISQFDDNLGFKTISSESFPETAMILSKREKEILSLIQQGYTSKLIADHLCISIYTVRAQRRNLLEKTKSSNAAQLLTNVLLKGIG
jgi:DNA-binding CsgD family transcriptional regulator